MSKATTAPATPASATPAPATPTLATEDSGRVRIGNGLQRF